MDDELAVQAAMNNALWCDAVCRAHGVPTLFADDAWVGRGIGPRFYPNLVTLSVAGVEEQMRLVSELRGSLGVWGWGVKDSFKVLDLVPHGFRSVLDGQWVCGREVDVSDGRPVRGLSTRRVDSADGLRGWESAWSVGQSQHERTVRVFLPALLEDPDIAFFSVMDGPEVVAGLAANRGGGVIGVTNLFIRSSERWIVRPCLALAAALWPGLLLVGYVSDKEMFTLHRWLGFRDIVGELRVWRFVGDDRP